MNTENKSPAPPAAGPVTDMVSAIELLIEKREKGYITFGQFKDEVATAITRFKDSDELQYPSAPQTPAGPVCVKKDAFIKPPKGGIYYTNIGEIVWNEQREVWINYRAARQVKWWLDESPLQGFTREQVEAMLHDFMVDTVRHSLSHNDIAEWLNTNYPER